MSSVYEFEDCGDFKKQLGDGKGVVKPIVDDRKHGTLKYKPKEEILQFNFDYGYWNAFGVIQHQTENLISVPIKILLIDESGIYKWI